jgi:hypothetical protein
LAHSATSVSFSRIWTVKVGSIHGHGEERQLEEEVDNMVMRTVTIGSLSNINCLLQNIF